MMSINESNGRHSFEKQPLFHNDRDASIHSG